jgi:hypothetical protein
MAFGTTAINMKGHAEKEYTWSHVSSRVLKEDKQTLYPDVFPQLLCFIISLITKEIINTHLTNKIQQFTTYNYIQYGLWFHSNRSQT